MLVTSFKMPVTLVWLPLFFRISIHPLSLIEVKWNIAQNHNFENIKFKVLILLKNQWSSWKRKIFANVLQLLLSLYKSYHIISLFSQNILKKHINKHVKGENSQKAKKGQKRAITQLRKKTTANLPTKESNKRKKNKLTLPIPSKPSMKRNQQQIKHTIIQCWRTRRTHSHSHRNKTKQKQNIKTSQAPKIKKRYIFTLLERKYVVLQLLSKLLIFMPLNFIQICTKIVKLLKNVG